MPAAAPAVAVMVKLPGFTACQVAVKSPEGLVLTVSGMTAAFAGTVSAGVLAKTPPVAVSVTVWFAMGAPC